MKLKRVVTISEDFAFGYEQMGGFQADVRRTMAATIVKKLWPPIVTPDYTPYSRRSAIATASARASPDRTRCVS